MFSVYMDFILAVRFIKVLYCMKFSSRISFKGCLGNTNWTSCLLVLNISRKIFSIVAKQLHDYHYIIYWWVYFMLILGSDIFFQQCIQEKPFCWSFWKHFMHRYINYQTLYFTVWQNDGLGESFIRTSWLEYVANTIPWQD